MQHPRRDLLTPLAGVLAAVSFVAGLICVAAGPDTRDSDAQVLAWYGNHGHRLTNLIGAYLLALCGLMILAFASGLRRRLRSADAGGHLANVAFGGGVLLVAMLWVGTAAAVSISGAKSFGGVQGPQSADLARFLPQVGYAAIMLFAMFGAITMIVATSVVALRSGSLPRWFAVLGIVCAVVLLFAVVFLPMVALPIWLIGASLACRRVGATDAEPVGLVARTAEQPA